MTPEQATYLWEQSDTLVEYAPVQRAIAADSTRSTMTPGPAPESCPLCVLAPGAHHIGCPLRSNPNK